MVTGEMKYPSSSMIWSGDEPIRASACSAEILIGIDAMISSQRVTGGCTPNLMYSRVMPPKVNMQVIATIETRKSRLEDLIWVTPRSFYLANEETFISFRQLQLRNCKPKGKESPRISLASSPANDPPSRTNCK